MSASGRHSAIDWPLVRSTSRFNRAASRGRHSCRGQWPPRCWSNGRRQRRTSSPPAVVAPMIAGPKNADQSLIDEMMGCETQHVRRKKKPA